MGCVHAQADVEAIGGTFPNIGEKHLDINCNITSQVSTVKKSERSPLKIKSCRSRVQGA